MRNIEPPLGLGSATKCFEIFLSLGAIAEINALIGACTESRKRCLLSSNQTRLLFAFNSRKKAKKSLGKPENELDKVGSYFLTGTGTLPVHICSAISQCPETFCRMTR